MTNLIYAPGNSGGVDVTTENDAGIIYLLGDALTDGSLRLIPDLVAGTEFELQLRSSGVWNDTGLVIAASTIYMNRELQVSAGGEYLLTKDTASDIRSLIPHVRFDAVDGTDLVLTVPNVSAIATNQIIQSDDTGLMQGTTIQFVGAATSLVLANALILQTSAAATGEVTLELHRTSYTDGLFYRRVYPASQFPAASSIILTTDGLVELLSAAAFYVTLTCDGTLSLRADSTNTTPYFGGNFYELTEDTITPDERGGALYKAVVADGGVVVADSEIVWSNAA